MKRWNQQSHKPDGWVERRRRFQKLFAESVRNAIGGQVPAVQRAVSPEAARAAGIRAQA